MKRVVQVATLFVIGLLIGAATAQQPKPAPTPPTIPEAVQAKFWKAQAQGINAQQALHATQQQWQAVADEIVKICGPDFQAHVDAQGNPECIAKTPAVKK